MRMQRLFRVSLGLFITLTILTVGKVTPSRVQSQGVFRAASLAAPALDTYDLTWFTIAGGVSTVTSADNVYTLSATVGQHDTGDGQNVYSLSGGFWSGVAPRQTVFIPMVRK
jgi:hypothetical protein